MKLKNILAVLIIATIASVISYWCFKINPESINIKTIGQRLEEGDKMGESFNIKIGKTFISEQGKIKIKFADIRSDSRCPLGAQCVWAGQVSIVLNVEYPQGKLENIELTLGAGANDSASIKNIGGYSIRLIYVGPNPRVGMKIEKSDYVASLAVYNLKNLIQD